MKSLDFFGPVHSGSELVFVCKGAILVHVVLRHSQMIARREKQTLCVKRGAVILPLNSPLPVSIVQIVSLRGQLSTKQLGR